MTDISRFNPYTMEDDKILRLNTGRDEELEFVRNIIERNIQGDQPPQHIVMHGPRGCGKSFFLRLLQINIERSKEAGFVLLPEEQLNIHQPAELLKAIKNFLLGEEADSSMGSWYSGGIEEWNKQLSELEKVILEKGHSHIVVGLENIDLLLNKGGAFYKSEDQFLLRDLLSEKKWLTLIATTLYPDIDTKYENALFHFFAKHELHPWKEKQHEDYLKRRDSLEGKKSGSISMAQLKSLSTFTGGSPRITVIMVDILNNNRLDSAARTLERTIDDLTPFYQDLLDRIPQKSRLLFDALVRGGEPCSQSELAKRVGTTQNIISQSFNWLLNHQYLNAEKLVGEKQMLYSVRDRLFAHFYKMRYVLHGTGRSILTVMSEFLMRFYSSKELKLRAMELYERGEESGSRDLMELALKSSGIRAETLNWRNDINALKQAVEFGEHEDIPAPGNLKKAREILNYTRDMLEAYEHFPEGVDSKEFAHNLFGSISISLEEKIIIAKAIMKGRLGHDMILRYYNISKNENNSKINSVGKSFNRFQNLMAGGKIMPEFEDNKSLEKWRDRDLDIYCIFIVSGLCTRFDKSSYLETKWNIKPVLKAPNSEIMIESHEHLAKLNEKENDVTAQAWNLLQIGWGLQKLGQHMESIDAYKKALELCVKEGNVEEQAWALEQMGRNLLMLNRYEESLEAFEKALELRIKDGKVEEQAWNLEGIGLNLTWTGHHVEAMDAHKKALELWIKDGNVGRHAWNLLQIGFGLQMLGRYEESIEAHKKALELFVKKGDAGEQAMNLRQIGINHKYLGQNEKSIEAHKKALELCIKDGDVEEQAWNLGQIAVNNILMGNEEEAWALIDKHSNSLNDTRYKMIKQLGDAVSFCEKRKDTARAYALGRRILENLHKRKNIYKPSQTIQSFFIILLEEKVGTSLIEDLITAAVDLFGPGIGLDLKGVDGVIKYIKSCKDKNVLLKMGPEIKSTVEKLVENLRL